MPAPSSLMSLPDARAVLNKAIESERGIRVKFATKQQASSFRFRCYTARKRDREMFRKTNPNAELDFSAWDVLQLTIRSSAEVGEQDDFWYLYLIHDETMALGLLETEDL